MKLVPTVVDLDEVAVEAVSKAGVCHGQIVDAFLILGIEPARNGVLQIAHFESARLRNAKVAKTAPRNRIEPIPKYVLVEFDGGMLPEAPATGFLGFPVQISSNGSLRFVPQFEKALFVRAPDQHYDAYAKADGPEEVMRTLNCSDPIEMFERCGEKL